MERDVSYVWQNLNVNIWKEVVKDCLPIMAGIVPLGLTCGIMGSSAGFSVFEITFMSMAVFAGAAQFMSIAMINSGVTSWAVIVFTTFLINLRHLFMGASLSPYLLKLSKPLQYLLAFSMVDESYALVISRIERKGYDLTYHLSVNGIFYFFWITSTFIGAAFYGYIPNPLEWGIDFIIPLTFLVLLVPRLKDRTALMVCLVSGLSAIGGALYLPGKWYIILAAFTACFAGGILERGKEKNES